MGMRMPETCWAVFKRQAINPRNCCIWLADSFQCMMKHGLAKPKKKKKKKFFVTKVAVDHNLFKFLVYWYAPPKIFCSERKSPCFKACGEGPQSVKTQGGARMFCPTSEFQMSAVCCDVTQHLINTSTPVLIFKATSNGLVFLVRVLHAWNGPEMWWNLSL